MSLCVFADRTLTAPAIEAAVCRRACRRKTARVRPHVRARASAREKIRPLAEEDVILEKEELSARVRPPAATRRTGLAMAAVQIAATRSASIAAPKLSRARRKKMALPLLLSRLPTAAEAKSAARALRSARAPRKAESALAALPREDP
ncbi:hypothetical protein T492DRAFT_831466 [Pavlovales sp. CCMP2436]|nr:hypothetical protein T492DRAFT_831466 [Pavlovales sp. CCMP2436]